MLHQRGSFLVFLSLLAIPSGSSAFAPSLTQEKWNDGHSKLQLATNNDNDSPVTTSRRNFGQQIMLGSITAVSTLTTTTTGVPMAAAAKDSTAEDKDKILQGYKRLNYLLDNWEKETTFCGTDIDPFTGKKKCERTPLKVMEYMGYRSTNDPLFKAEKTLRRLEALAPSAKDAEYFDAVEKWQQTADEASGMAYTSSWAGPQNPNGGDDSIEYYLDRAKEQVVSARDVLKNVIDILQL